MPRKWDEVILPFERMITVPGLHSVWSKRSFVQVFPLGTSEIRLQTPARQDVIVRKVEIDPANALTLEYGQVNFLYNGSPNSPDGIIFRPANAGLVLQMENVNMAHIPGGVSFGWRFTNTSPFFIISYWLNAQIYTERTAN
jgi:hypothetical protein